MNKFLIKLIVFCLPIALICFLIEFSLRGIPNDYKLKRNYLDNKSDDIEILILGNSHAYYGINPVYLKAKGFNAANVSQSLDFDFEIIKKYKGRWSNLKQIIITVSYGSLFEKLSDATEFWRIKNYVLYFSIEDTFRLKTHFEITNGLLFDNLIRIKDYYIINKSAITCNDLGSRNLLSSTQQENLTITGEEAALRNTVTDYLQSFKEIKPILDSIVDFAYKNELRLLFVTTPACESFRANLDKGQLDFYIKTMNNVMQEHDHCSYLNLLDDPHFEDKDFHNGDHLNTKGAIKLTLKIDSIIQKMFYSTHEKIIEN